MQAMFSCVIPSGLICGGMGQRIEFPQWLGKNSKHGRLDRLLQELQSHMRLSTSSSKRSMNLDYIPHLRKVLTSPLMTQEPAEINPGVSRVIQVMADYDLTREDWECVLEVGQFEGQKDPIASIQSKVKAAFTRAYNKENRKTPYVIRAAPKKGRKGAAEQESQGFDEEGMEQLSGEMAGENDDDNIENDAMIKTTKRQAKASVSARKSTSQETGKGKGKGKGKNRK
ncbi:Replication factor C subunit 1 [Acropora cervicornis]|uniref:Replication factor C subunit 1 n=2 Tax=Acropora TaxID=6127 RepID=A0AAD9V0M7_ACRCE|nr:Replication factor C subunit 1 [Acropora cervicornis]